MDQNSAMEDGEFVPAAGIPDTGVPNFGAFLDVVLAKMSVFPHQQAKDEMIS